MKKILLIIGLLLIVGCSSSGNNDVVKIFNDKVNKTKSYRLQGTLEIQNDEETFLYNVDVSYTKPELYKVEMVNTSNDHKQIILKNEEGLYVITPSLNKSFKFDSTWPANSSQAYILSSLINDINKDETTKVTIKDDEYIIKCKVNYPNNADLKYQNIYLDKDNAIKKVEVFSDADIKKINAEFTKVDMKAGIKESEYELKNYISVNEPCEEDTCNDKETMGKIENAIYPLYMPSNTYLSASEVINSDSDNRVILTFSGNKNFVIVEEKAFANEEHEVIPVYGEPLMLNDTIAVLSTNSMQWTSNDIDYYLLSEDLSISEMVFIASSLGNTQATIGTK